jgi:hypothetical protein
MLRQFLLTILQSKGSSPDVPKPWLKGNSEVIAVGISDLQFDISEVEYTNTFGGDNIVVGISDILLTVTTV